MRRRLTKDVTGSDVTVWGIPFDASVSNRPGTRFGRRRFGAPPRFFDNDPQYPFHADLFEALGVVDYGDCLLDYRLPERAPISPCAPRPRRFWQRPASSDAGRRSFDHVPPAAGACREARPSQPRPLRRAPGYVAARHRYPRSPPRRSRLVRLGRPARALDRPETRSRSASAPMRRRPAASRSCTVTRSRTFLVRHRRAHRRARRRPRCYLTFDIDCLDVAYAPGTGTPVAGGPSSAKMLAVLRRLGGLDIVGADLVEVSPPYDHADMTAVAGATVAMYVLGSSPRRRRADFGAPQFHLQGRSAA